MYEPIVRPWMLASLRRAAGEPMEFLWLTEGPAEIGGHQLHCQEGWHGVTDDDFFLMGDQPIMDYLGGEELDLLA